jgi:hypothetical protein
VAVKRRFLNERSGTIFNSNQPNLTAFQGDQVCVTARIASRPEEWPAEAELAVLVPRDCFLTSALRTAIVPGWDLPARLSAAFADRYALSGAQKRSPQQSKLVCAVAE